MGPDVSSPLRLGKHEPQDVRTRDRAATCAEKNASEFAKASTLSPVWVTNPKSPLSTRSIQQRRSAGPLIWCLNCQFPISSSGLCWRNQKTKVPRNPPTPFRCNPERSRRSVTSRAVDRCQHQCTRCAGPKCWNRKRSHRSRFAELTLQRTSYHAMARSCPGICTPGRIAFTC